MTKLPDNIVAYRDYPKYRLHLCADGALIQEHTDGTKPRLEAVDIRVGDVENYILIRRMTRVGGDTPSECP